MTTSRRPRRSTGVVLLVVALASLATVWSVLVPRGGARAAESAGGRNDFTAADIAAGRQLYLTGCASCHGAAGQGGTQAQAPSLIGVGAASVDFQVSTGRMPLKEIGAQAERKPPAYDAQQTKELAAYVASLGAGPEIPEVDPAKGDVALGAELFRGNCANCHNFAGQGGALSSGKYAPALSAATSQQVGTAIRSGPESMPVFSNRQLSAHEVDSLAAYIQFLRNTPDPGGNGLGRLGPLPEGMIIWIFGIGGCAALCLWIGKRSPRLSKKSAEAHH